MTPNDSVGERQQTIAATAELLGSWRLMLKILLGLQVALPAAALPAEVPVNVARARREIAELKARLRGWGESADDQPDDAETAAPSEIAHALSLLAVHRRNLAQLSAQRAQFAERDVPLHIANGIAEAQAQIERLLAQLRQWQVPTEP